MRSSSRPLLLAVAVSLASLVPAPPGSTGWAVSAASGDPEQASAPEPSQAGAPLRLFSPEPGSAVGSPLLVQGEARGEWYFEASFTVRLLDPSGAELALAVAQAQAPWMTEDFVPFTAQLVFEASPGSELTLVLERANPSGLARFDQEVRLPLRGR